MGILLFFDFGSKYALSIVKMLQKIVTIARGNTYCDYKEEINVKQIQKN